MIKLYQVLNFMCNVNSAVTMFKYSGKVRNSVVPVLLDSVNRQIAQE